MTTGLTPVKKFKDRTAAVSRICEAIQSLDGGATEPATAAPTAPTKTKTAARQIRLEKLEPVLRESAVFEGPHYR